MIRPTRPRRVRGILREAARRITLRAWKRAQKAYDTSAAQYVPPGHFYSPIPSLDDVRKSETSIFEVPESLVGIDLRIDEQLTLLKELAALCVDHPFSSTPTPGTHYHFENDFFSYGDALILHGMLRYLQPARVVEVGSGYSTALIQDTIRLFGLPTDHVAIDPFPDTAQRLLGDAVHPLKIESIPVQQAPRELLTSLGPRDILFIDSTHVSKVGSDVNALVLGVLPRLERGVFVHIHDIFYPFELPREWVYEGRAWNENYLMHAFLTFNDRFRIVLFNNLLARFRARQVADLLPLWERNKGCSLWLERI